MTFYLSKLSRALAVGDLTARALTETCLEAIASEDGERAFIEVYTDRVRVEADQIDQVRQEGRALPTRVRELRTAVCGYAQRLRGRGVANCAQVVLHRCRCRSSCAATAQGRGSGRRRRTARTEVHRRWLRTEHRAQRHTDTSQRNHSTQGP